MKDSKKIIVLAYALSPTRGSEYSVAWNYVKYMSRNNELVVLYGMSGDHMGDIDELQDYITKEPMPNIRFIPIKPNRWANALNWFNRHNILVYTFFLAYRVWQKSVYKVALEITKKESFDLVHYVGPIGYREPGYLWKLNLPYIWGSIGGTTTINPILIESLTLAGKVKQVVRAFLNKIQLHCNTRIRKAIKRSDVLLSATTENQEIIKKVYGVDSFYLPENAIEKCYPLNNTKFNKEGKLELIFVGHVDSRKSLITVLQSLTKVRNKQAVSLNVVGDGPLIDPLKEFCRVNNIENLVKWHGKVNRETVFELMNNAHLHLITSVMEGNPTTIWEAMSKGVPTLSLKHCGMRDTICDKCGFSIDIISVDQITTDIAQIIDNCIIQPSLLEKKAQGVIKCRENYLWDNRVEIIDSFYNQAISNYRKQQPK